MARTAKQIAAQKKASLASARKRRKKSTHSDRSKMIAQVKRIEQFGPPAKSLRKFQAGIDTTSIPKSGYRKRNSMGATLAHGGTPSMGAPGWRN